MATSRGWKINQSPVYPSLDHNYRKRLRRSIEYLRQKNRLGYDDGSSTESRWEWCGGSPTDDETQEHRLRQIKGCHSSPKTLPTDGVYHRHQKAVCPGRIERLVRGQLDTHGKHLRSRGRGRKRGRLLLIIDVQSRQGAIEEVYVREGDNVFLLAEAFTIRCDNTSTTISMEMLHVVCGLPIYNQELHTTATSAKHWCVANGVVHLYYITHLITSWDPTII